MELHLKFITVFLFCCNIYSSFAGNLARGFNDDVNWKSYKAGLDEAKSSGKPIMLLIHKTWCGACKALKPRVATSMEIQELSSNFVMINIEDDEEKDLPGEGRDFQPDGGYIPRIMFLDSDGVLKKDVTNVGGNPKYKHYYSDEHQIAKSMKDAMKIMSGPSHKNKEL